MRLLIENMQKQDIVLSLIKKATVLPGAEKKGIRGKKALQKSLYLLNLKFPVFNYRWGDYGPLCVEIQHIAEDLVDQGYVTITDVPTKREEAVIKNLQTTDNSYEISVSDSVDKELDEIVSFISNKEPRELELLASVHFWADRQQELMGEYSVDYILEKLTQLKPEANFTKENVVYAIAVLEEEKYLSKLF